MVWVVPRKTWAYLCLFLVTLVFIIAKTRCGPTRWAERATADCGTVPPNFRNVGLAEGTSTKSANLAFTAMVKQTPDSDDDSPHRKRQKLTTESVVEAEKPVRIQTSNDLHALLIFEQDTGPHVKQSEISTTIMTNRILISRRDPVFQAVPGVCCLWQGKSGAIC